MKDKIPGILKSPVRQLVLSFLILISAGTALLLLPWASHSGFSFTDALFTSTSAVCVTGLVVADTAGDLTFFGQAVILVLIQLGGLGIMTFSIAIFSMLGGEFSIKWRFTFNSIYNNVKIVPARDILVKIVLFTMAIESLTALILFTRFIQDFPLRDALWHSVFHAVSAFCNAGFSTFSNSLVGYSKDVTVILTTSFAVILGGLGFIVLTEIRNMKFKMSRDFFRQFSLHTKIVLFVSLLLIVSGTAAILGLEWNFSMASLPASEKCLTAFFQSVSCRTAGFNSIDISSLRESTLTIMMLLMFIGGSPGSIAGGIKTTTFAVIAGLIAARFRGNRQVVFWNRAIESETVHRSTTLVILGFLFIYTSAVILLSMHSFDIENSFQSVLFEVVSAFATVGLSTGITSHIPFEGKILLSLVMFIGRVGPFALIAAFTANRRDLKYEIAEENIMIG